MPEPTTLAGFAIMSLANMAGQLHVSKQQRRAEKKLEESQPEKPERLDEELKVNRGNAAAQGRSATPTRLTAFGPSSGTRVGVPTILVGPHRR